MPQFLAQTPAIRHEITIDDSIGEDSSGRAMIQRELIRLGNEKKVNLVRLHGVSGLPGELEADCLSVFLADAVPVNRLVNALSRVAISFERKSLLIASESDLMGSEPVPSQLLNVRRKLIQERLAGVHADMGESAWLIQTVGEMLGKSELSSNEMDASLEHLGIDSLGRLQLWHSFKRKFPNSKMSQISSTLPLKMLVGAQDEEGIAKEEQIRKKTTWLALHGFRTNPLIMEHQIGLFMNEMFGENVHVVYAQAPHAARGPCPQGIQDGFEWWYTEQDESYDEGWKGSKPKCYKDGTWRVPYLLKPLLAFYEENGWLNQELFRNLQDAHEQMNLLDFTQYISSDGAEHPVIKKMITSIMLDSPTLTRKQKINLLTQKFKNN